MTHSILAAAASCLDAALAAAPAQAEISRLSMYLPPGIVVVLGLALLVRELRKSLPEVEASPAAGPVAEQASAAAEVPIAVIAAAVAAAVDQPHRIVSVSLEPRQLAWSIEGRRQLLTSHQIRR
ncbi:MAG TPA: hypothetical protein VGK67_36990 [Myxococcales bacterium]|jgi:hypothetical protein